MDFVGLELLLVVCNIVAMNYLVFLASTADRFAVYGQGLRCSGLDHS